MRTISLDAIKERFSLHRKLHRFEVDELFKNIEHKKFTEMQYRYLEIGIRHQGVFDIETASFDPREKFIISYDMLLRDLVTEKVEHVGDSMTRKDINDAVINNNFHFDRRLLGTLSYNLHQCHHVVGHFSSKFDMPYFRSRCLMTKQPKLIPPYGYLLYGDTWRMMKNSLKAPRNTLKNLAIYTNTPDQKTWVDLKWWFKAWFKDSKDWQKSMDYITDHCEKDVKMTLKALKKIEVFNNIGRLRV